MIKLLTFSLNIKLFISKCIWENTDEYWDDKDITENFLKVLKIYY